MTLGFIMYCGGLLLCLSLPVQAMPPRLLSLSHIDAQALDDALCWFLAHSIVEPCAPGASGFFSSVFLSLESIDPAQPGLVYI